MPVERCALAYLESMVDELEKDNRIVGIGYPDEGSAVIHYEPRTKRAKSGERETRDPTKHEAIPPGVRR